MNFFSLGILIVSTHFVLHFYKITSYQIQKRIRYGVWIYAIVQFILYVPYIHTQAYKAFYPLYLSVQEYRTLEYYISQGTRLINITILGLGLIALIVAWKNSPNMKIFRWHHMLLTLSYGILFFVYASFISVTPGFYIRVSKIANTLTYLHIKLGSNIFIYQILPYLVILSIGIIAYCAYRLEVLNHQASLEELHISKSISASETTSKIFCHYIKNEILALQSQVETLSGNNKEEILHHFDYLYNRIDEIHRSTKTDSLQLKFCSIESVLEETLHILSERLSHIEITKKFPAKPTTALIDTTYVGQALHNIIINAVDAMEDNQERKRALEIEVTTLHTWIHITITDTGKGIHPDNISRIFLPFYSSHPYAKHWGVGLSLTYKIIQAHEGKIMVSSRLGQGSSFEILLPYMNRYKEIYP